MMAQCTAHAQLKSVYGVSTLICRSVVIEKGRQFHACAFIAIQNQYDLTRMREIDYLFL